MEPKLRQYVLNLFKNAPNTKRAVEFREEIICNIIEHYHNHLDGGMSEEDAYNIAISSVGDIDELIKELESDKTQTINNSINNEMNFSNIGFNSENGGVNYNNASQGYYDYQSYNNQSLTSAFKEVKERSGFFKTIAIVLFIVSIVPPIAFSTATLNDVSYIQSAFETVGQALFFLFVSIGVGLLVYNSLTSFFPAIPFSLEKQTTFRKSLFRALGIALYIDVPFTGLIGDYLSYDEIIIMIIFLQIVGATVLVVFSKNIEKPAENLKEQYNMWYVSNKENDSTTTLYKVLVALLWIVTAIAYVIVTLITFISCSVIEISVTWILFVLAFVIQKFMRAVFDCIREGKKNEI